MAHLFHLRAPRDEEVKGILLITECVVTGIFLLITRRILENPGSLPVPESGAAKESRDVGIW